MNEAIVRYVDMPCYMRGYTMVDANMDYNIYINARLSYWQQQDALNHELNHIKNNDFYNNKPIKIIEGGLVNGMS